MGFFSEIRTALNEIFAEFSQYVQFRGKTYKCIIGENGQQEVELESGGFVPNETFTVKFKEADLEDDAYPSIGELLQYSGRTFRIHWISTRSKRGQIEVWVRSVDMGSAIGRQKWGLIIGQKLAQMGEFIETAFRDISNYILGTFNTVGRYINGQFGNFITPIRNAITDFISYLGNALAKIVGYFDSDWERAINKAVNALDKLREESNKLSQKDNGKSFSEIFTEEMATTKLQNDNRKRSDLWTSGSVDWYKTQIAEAERLRDIEKQAHIEAENARKAKYAAADATPEIKDAGKGSKSKSKFQYNDSSLAKIGGGGLTATRYDVAEKQLNESKKQSKLLTKIAENTEKQNSDMREIIMR